MATTSTSTDPSLPWNFNDCKLTFCHSAISVILRFSVNLQGKEYSRYKKTAKDTYRVPNRVSLTYKSPPQIMNL